MDYSKSIAEHEHIDIDKSSIESYVVQTCEKLYHKPLVDFTVEDLRVMIGQNIGLKYLIPLAIEELKINPLVSGDLYSGDLLHNIFNSDEKFWQEHPYLKKEIGDIITETINDLSNALEKFII